MEIPRAGSSHSAEFSFAAAGNDMAALSLKLAEPIDPDKLKTRPIQGGKQAAYIPGEMVIATANEVFGFHQWSDEIRKLEVDYCVQDSDKRWNIGVYAIMRVYFVREGKPVCWREDVGYGSAARSPNLDFAMEQARKAAITDARKRCLRLFGESFGTSVSSAEFQEAARAQHRLASANAQAAATAQKFSSTSRPSGPPPQFAAPVSSVVPNGSTSVISYKASDLLSAKPHENQVQLAAEAGLAFSLPDDLLGALNEPIVQQPLTSGNKPENTSPDSNAEASSGRKRSRIEMEAARAAALQKRARMQEGIPAESPARHAFDYGSAGDSSTKRP